MGYKAAPDAAIVAAAEDLNAITERLEARRDHILRQAEAEERLIKDGHRRH